MLDLFLSMLPVAGNTTTTPVVEVRTIPDALIDVAPLTDEGIPDVPFYSQFADISSSKWKKVGCGITSLAMVIDYYQPGPLPVSVDKLLGQGVDAGAFDQRAGWIHSGLISLARDHGLDGATKDVSRGGRAGALRALKTELRSGPVIASVHYKFEPTNPIPHLVVVNGIDGDTVYYNDPAAKGGNKQMSVTKFMKAWKERYIVLRPVEEEHRVAMAG